MPEDWRGGQRVGFDVCVRPVRRLPKDLVTPAGKFLNGSEVDAFLSEALRCYPDNREGMAAAQRSRESVYLDWLAERLAPAAEVDRQATRLVRFQRTRVSRGERAHEGPDATFHGTLTVTDPDAFIRSAVTRRRPAPGIRLRHAALAPAEQPAAGPLGDAADDSARELRPLFGESDLFRVEGRELVLKGRLGLDQRSCATHRPAWHHVAGSR